MNAWRIFWVVFNKEFRELRRDRKSLFWLFAPPIVLPGIAIVAALFIGSQTARFVTDGFPVAVINAKDALGLVQTLKSSKALIVSEYPDSDSAAKNTVSLITLIVPDDFQKRLDSGQPAHLTLTPRDNGFTSTLALGAVRSEISTYNNSLVEARLKTFGLDRAWLTPVVVDETQIAAASTSVTAPAENGQASGAGGLGAIFLPLAVTSWLVGGGLGLIVDTTVGEKERQTIESVLVTPASRLGVVTGKLSVVFLASLLVMGLWMIEGVFLSLVGEVGPKLLAAQQGGGSVDLLALVAQSGRDLGTLIVILIVLLIPFIVMLNSLVMAFCSFASSYRESNTFMFLLQLILPALVLLSIFSIAPNAGAGWYATPLLGTIIAIRDLFSQTLTSANLGLAVVSAGVYAVLTLGLASYIYSREWALVRGV